MMANLTLPPPSPALDFPLSLPIYLPTYPPTYLSIHPSVFFSIPMTFDSLHGADEEAWLREA